MGKPKDPDAYIANCQNCGLRQWVIPSPDKIVTGCKKCGYFYGDSDKFVHANE